MRARLAAGVTSLTRVRRLPRRVRAALVLVHVVASAGWLGLDGAMVALEVTGLHSGDAAVRAGIAIAMAVIACWVLIPVVFASLCSGLVLGLGTSWGLARHWWLVGKSGIAVVLTATGVAMMVPRLHQVLAGEGEPVQAQTLAARSGALVLLLAATGLSVVKPWGKTRLAGTGTQPRASARGAASARAAANQRTGRSDALDDIMVRQGARSAQLHALRALDGRRVLRAAPDEPSGAGGSLLVRGSRTWIDTTASTDAAAVVRPRRQTVPRRRRPPRWSRSGTRPRA
ncbi:MAG: hypothetical protein ACRDRO_02810 [Pseudonocardiaceae bacterium]